MGALVAGITELNGVKTTKTYKFTITPVDPESGEEITDQKVEIFRAPEILTELLADTRKSRSNLRFFSPYCGIYHKIRLALCPHYKLVPDPEYHGVGMRKWIWAPHHIAKVASVGAQGLPDRNKTESFESPIVSWKELEAIHKGTARQGDLGFKSDGSTATWAVYERPADKVYVAKRRTKGRIVLKDTDPKSQPQVGPQKEVPNGILLREAVISSFEKGYLPKTDQFGRHIWEPDDTKADLDAICSTDPEINPLLDCPIIWRVERVRRKDDEDVILETEVDE